MNLFIGYGFLVPLAVPAAPNGAVDLDRTATRSRHSDGMLSNVNGGRHACPSATGSIVSWPCALRLI